VLPEQAKADFSRTKRIAWAGDNEKSQNAYPEFKYFKKSVYSTVLLVGDAKRRLTGKERRPRRFVLL